MSLGYFAMPLHLPGSDPARATEQDLDRLGFLDARRFEEAWIGEHFTARWENILCPVRTSSWRQRWRFCPQARNTAR
jgi:hypothetical protein